MYEVVTIAGGEVDAIAELGAGGAVGVVMTCGFAVDRVGPELFADGGASVVRVVTGKVESGKVESDELVTGVSKPAMRCGVDVTAPTGLNVVLTTPVAAAVDESSSFGAEGATASTFVVSSVAACWTGAIAASTGAVSSGTDAATLSTVCWTGVAASSSGAAVRSTGAVTPSTGAVAFWTGAVAFCTGAVAFCTGAVAF